MDRRKTCRPQNTLGNIDYSLSNENNEAQMCTNSLQQNCKIKESQIENADS